MCKSLLYINVHADLSSRARGLNFGPSLQLHPYIVYASCEGSSMFVYASCEGSSMFAHLCRLTYDVA